MAAAVTNTPKLGSHGEEKHKDGGTVGKRSLVSRSRGGESSTGGNMIVIHGMHGIHA